MTRVDMLLTVFDRAIERLEQAQQAFAAENQLKAQSFLLRAQGLVIGLASGVDPNAAIAPRILPLYSFVVTAISKANPEPTRDALKILVTLREGFRAIRTEAVELERQGVIPPLRSTTLVHSMA